MSQKIIKYVLYLPLLVFISKTSLAKEADSLEPFISNLKDYFSIYYSQIEEKEIINSKEQVLRDIKKIALKYCRIDKGQILSEANFDDLSKLLDEYLRNYGKSINIFTVNDSSIVNCWLGDLSGERIEKKEVWGNEIEFIVKLIDNLKIKDFTYYLSEGKESLEVGTRDNIIYYNLDSYKIRANSIWDFFIDREKGNKNKRYDRSKSNRLRKWLYYKTWSNLYTDCIKNNQDLEEAKNSFINQAIVLLEENSLFHEAGHIFANRYLRLNDETRQELAAFLTELRYGPLLYESLETVVAASYKSPISSYNSAGRKIIHDFITYIDNEQKKKNPEYKNISILGRNQIEKMNNLYRLTDVQIHAISEHIYKEKKLNSLLR